jgi:putative DNA primase/helicase
MPYSPFEDSSTDGPSLIDDLADIEQMLKADAEETQVISQRHGSGRYEITKDGVFLVSGVDTRTRICDRLLVVASTRDAVGNLWGRLLRWHDPDGRLHTWAMPSALLHGDNNEVLKELASGGLGIEPGMGLKIREYILSWKVDKRVRCVAQPGWHGPVFCTPEETFGGGLNEEIVYQASSSVTSEYSCAGSSEHWRSTVAKPAAGNSRLVFAISCALAGPFLEIAGEESGGFHLVGQSSSGKTTALRVAASVWGPERRVRPWRATANGLEGLASIHNDCLLILDELSQCDPRQAGEAAYMLANGRGKARASRTGSARESTSWRVLFLSSGEVSLTTLMETAGKSANAGQELRLATVPADAGVGLGIFETLHGARSASAFACKLKDDCSQTYGAVGREWLMKVVEKRTELMDGTDAAIRMFIDAAVPPGSSGQVHRVARRFGLVAAAGEFATHYGLTGWKEGEATQAALICFNAWLANYGSGNREDGALIGRVRLFLEMHGTSRFAKADAEGDRIINQAGYWREEQGVRQFLFTPQVYKSELVAGFDPKRAAEVLKAAGMILTDSDRLTRTVRINGHPKRVYCIVMTDEVSA